MNPTSPRRRILLVEDNQDNRVIYGTMLRAHGFDVHEVDGGEAAVSVARTTRPELVLMDLGLPLVDGVEATRRLKGNPETAAIPVLALTAHGLASERARAEAAGVDGYLMKPISSEALLRAVMDALNRGNASTVRPAESP